MSQIVINLQGATQDQTNRIRRILEIMFDQRLFDFSNGSIHLSFDAEGVLRVIDWEKTKWRKDKMTTPLVINAFENFSVEMKL